MNIEKQHQPNCACAVCRFGEDAIHRRELQSLTEHGWYAHLVSEASDYPWGYNCHTHRVLESFGHPDIEIVLPLAHGVTMGILHGIVNRIKAGSRFVPGVLYDDVLQRYQVQFARSLESGRSVLRLILPDERGQTDSKSIASPYSHQWHGLDLREMKGM